MDTTRLHPVPWDLDMLIPSRIAPSKSTTDGAPSAISSPCRRMSPSLSRLWHFGTSTQTYLKVTTHVQDLFARRGKTRQVWTKQPCSIYWKQNAVTSTINPTN